MKTLRRAFFAVLGFACLAPSFAQAEAVKYQMYATSSGPTGWFIYDRAAATLLDYQVTFSEATFGYPTANFLPPATSLLFANSDEFSFSDATVTGTTPVGTFDSTLNFFQVTFANGVLSGGDGQPGHELIGTYLANIRDTAVPGSIQGSSGGFLAQYQGYFFSLGPVGVSPVPEPETYAMLLAGLGLLGWSMRRKKQNSLSPFQKAARAKR